MHYSIHGMYVSFGGYFTNSFSARSPILITCNIIYLISSLLLWWYMTCYLVVPINTVKKSIEEVAAGNLSIHISEFGNNCAGRLIPGINSLSENISALVREIRSSSQTAMTLSVQLAARSLSLSVKTEQQSASLIQTAASMDEMAASTKTMRIIPEWRAYRRIVQPNAPVKAVN